MIKELKYLSVIMVVLSIIFCIGGFTAFNLSRNYKGIKVSSVRMVNGEFVTDREEVLGGNKKAEAVAKAVSVVCYVLSGVSIFMGIILTVAEEKKNNTYTIRQRAVILEEEKENFKSVIVKLEDGTIKKLFVESPPMVSIGDKGIIGIKDNLLVEFNKEV